MIYIQTKRNGNDDSVYVCVCTYICIYTYIQYSCKYIMYISTYLCGFIFLFFNCFCSHVFSTLRHRYVSNAVAAGRFSSNTCAQIATGRTIYQSVRLLITVERTTATGPLLTATWPVLRKPKWISQFRKQTRTPPPLYL